jgi:protein-tyrosine phosphatase
MTLSRHLALRGAYNIRDLGGYETASGGTIPWRRFFRADSLHRLADGEAQRLHQVGLSKVIDLRTPVELAEKPNPFQAFPDVQFVNLPLFDDLSPAALSKTKRPGDDPLLSFYMAALDTRGAAICAIMSEIATVEQGAVLFNCTAGKDRTGIIAALLLGLAEVPHDQIIADYTLTAGFISDLVAEFLELSRARGGDTESYAKLLQSPAPTMANTLTRIETRHGSIPDYLTAIGMSADAVARLRDRLLIP